MDANMFADCWVKNTGESDDPFWTNCARYLICSIVLHLRATEPDAPLSRLADFIASKSFEEIKDLLTESPSAEAKRKAANFLANMAHNERLIGSIMTDIGNRFQLFDSDNVRAVTSINEIDFNAMVDRPTALYLSIPRSEVPIYRPLMACFTMQMFRAWEQRAASSPNGSLPRGIACYMDEFANIGHIPGYAHFISTARYLRVSLLMVLQNFSQLDAAYGADDAETIRANANTHLLLPGAGLRECQYYSERIGNTTVPTWTRSKKPGAWTGLADTWTQSEAQRRLLTPEEIRTMPPRSVLLLRSTLPPMMLTATPYYEDRKLSQLANIPYMVQHVRPEPLADPPQLLSATMPPGQNATGATELQNAETVKTDNQEFFL
jgi:type IV secretion system protein VirD4